MAVRGKHFEYLLAGRDMFPPGRTHEWYPAMKYHVEFSTWVNGPEPSPIYSDFGVLYIPEVDYSQARVTWLSEVNAPPGGLAASLTVRLLGGHRPRAYIELFWVREPPEIGMPYFEDALYQTYDLDMEGWGRFYASGPATYSLFGLPISDNVFGLSVLFRASLWDGTPF